MAEHTVTEISKDYKVRSKRWISLTTKGLWKAAPMIVTSLGMVYQETEIWNLNKQVKDAKTKMVLTANTLLNITEVEYEAMEGKLNEVIIKQQEVLMEEQVINYAENIVLLFTNIQLKHETITDILPYDDLVAYITPLLNKLPTMKLPDIGDEIFHVYSPTKSLEGSMVVVSFTIHLVLSKNHVAWVVIAASSITLSNNAKVQIVVTDNSSKTYTDITSQPINPYKIIDNVKMITMYGCLQQIFTNAEPTDCLNSEANLEQVFDLPNNLAIIFATQNRKVSVQCSSKEHPLAVTAIVNTSECTIVTDNRVFAGHQPININMGNEDIEIIRPDLTPMIQPLAHNPLAMQQRSSLKAELDRWTSPDTGRIIIEVIAALIIFAALAVCIRCCTQRPKPKPESKWFPDYDGPMKPSSFNNLHTMHLPPGIVKL